MQAVVGWDELARRGSAAAMLTLLALSLGTLAGVALLVSRGRSRGAKWLLLMLLLLGLPMFFISLGRGTIVGWGLLAVLQASLQVGSIALLFTPSAREWLGKGS
nr:hypothetical protein [uncultured Sphingosinicella sp.]